MNQTIEGIDFAVEEKDFTVEHIHYADRDGNVAVLPITKRQYLMTPRGWVRIKPQ